MECPDGMTITFHAWFFIVFVALIILMFVLIVKYLTDEAEDR
jgi:hypothetical protein